MSSKPDKCPSASPPKGRPAISHLFTPVFTLLIAVCAKVSIPMAPVPMTLQTFAVLLAGAVLGPVWGGAAVVLYLVLAALGLPILSDGASGPAAFSGPTAGYLFAFPVAAVLAGMAMQRGWLERVAAATILLSALHLLILGLGTGWLATRIGLGPAMAVGFTPFLIGAVVKSLLVALSLRGLPSVLGHRRVRQDRRT